MIDSTVQFTKIRNVKSPVRANTNDAGSDWFIPEYDEKFLKDLLEANALNDLNIDIVKENGKELVSITIPPQEQVKIPAGIKVWIMNKNTYLQATNKSGVATKLRLIVGADTIDADYQGEVHINLINTSNIPVIIESGQKIVQFIHKEYIRTDWEEVSNEEYDNIGTSDRGAGGFGSTGDK
jgi:dUTP pyrophosphatase